MAVGTECDHDFRVAASTKREIIDVVNVEDRQSGLRDVIRLTSALRILAAPSTTIEHSHPRSTPPGVPIHNTLSRRACLSPFDCGDKRDIVGGLLTGG
jgi:hypothetical protein